MGFVLVASIRITEAEHVALIEATGEAPGRSVPTSFGSEVRLLRADEPAQRWALLILAEMRNVPLKREAEAAEATPPRGAASPS